MAGGPPALLSVILPRLLPGVPSMIPSTVNLGFLQMFLLGNFQEFPETSEVSPALFPGFPPGMTPSVLCRIILRIALMIYLVVSSGIPPGTSARNFSMKCIWDFSRRSIRFVFQDFQNFYLCFLQNFYLGFLRNVIQKEDLKDI